MVEPNNFIPILLNILQIAIVIFGFLAHAMFFHFVIMNKYFRHYSRITFAAVSFGMIVMLLTATFGFLETLLSGKLIEDSEINSRPRRQLWFYIHSYGEFMVVASEFWASSERMVSIINPKLYTSVKFTAIFYSFVLVSQVFAGLYIFAIRLSRDAYYFVPAFVLANLMEFANFGMLIYLYFNSRDLYIKTRGTTPLHCRYQYSETYSWSKCLLPPALFSTCFKTFMFGYVWLFLLGFFSNEQAPYYYFFMNLFINMYCAVFPCLVMRFHTKTRKRILQFFNVRSFKVKEAETPPIFALDGGIINKKQTQAEYFNQLDNTWS